METLRKRELLLICLMVAAGIVSSTRGAAQSASNPPSTFKQYCFQCHGKAATGGMNLELLTGQSSVGDSFEKWDKVATALEQKRMPPKGMPQPDDAERAHTIAWIRTELNTYAKKHDGEPGRVTVRRLTSGEYDYTIQDLTGVDIDTPIDASSDSVGGEGFTNFGDVQFMQDANLERYLEAAKIVADHAVVGAGPIEFFTHPGKTGFELSAVTRLKTFYANYGFRTVSGEGGGPLALEHWDKALYVTWRYQHRAVLGEPAATLKGIALREGVNPRFADHIWSVMNNRSLAYPSSDMAAHWNKLPTPGPDIKASDAAGRAACTELRKYITLWPSWLFARGDLAAGGQGDESPLEFTDRTLKAETTHRFTYVRGGRRGGRGAAPAAGGPARVYLNIASVNPVATGKGIIIWRNPTVGIRPAAAGPGRGQRPVTPPATPPVTPPTTTGGQTGAQVAEQPVAAGTPRRGGLPPGPRQSLRSVVTEETLKRLNFGVSPDGSPIGPDDFATEGEAYFDVNMPQGQFTLDLQVDAELGAARDFVFRAMVSDSAEIRGAGGGGGTTGVATRALIGDMKSEGYKKFRAGVMEYVALLPPNSNSEPTPADKDPVPAPFDSTYNVPEHDDFVIMVKYIRDDKFVMDYLVDDATRVKINNAWNDVYTSFEHHDNYLLLLARHFGVDLKGKGMAQMDQAQMEALPAEMRKYVEPIRAVYLSAVAAEKAAQPGHVQDCLDFASRAWRRPLTEKEKQSLRSFYDKAMSSEQDHTKAIKATLTRILVAPQFLYRVEQPSASVVKPLSEWELASRISYFLWSSIPDAELRRAASVGELNNPQQLQRQVKRMLADPKARRLATEFFGQWLGFYHFDEFKGVDTTRFPEFTNEVRASMYDEAVSFFEHIIRKDRPVREMLYADYDFLNKPLAKFYGVKKEVKSGSDVEMVDGANGFQRGGLLRLGAVLTSTSAPLRTSPVKRGDWILRRVLGTPVPPPPADAGSIPADDKNFGGLSVKARLEVHKRNATCANCHARMDPLGFSLEHYDSTGRWREQYPDGKPIEDSAALSDQTEINGIDGILKYLQTKDAQVRRTLSRRLIGYSLGRTVAASDELLIERMVSAGPDSTFSQLAGEIVTSRQFRNRLGREDGPAPVKVAAVKNSNTGAGQ